MEGMLSSGPTSSSLPNSLSGSGYTGSAEHLVLRLSCARKLSISPKNNFPKLTF